MKSWIEKGSYFLLAGLVLACGGPGAEDGAGGQPAGGGTATTGSPGGAPGSGGASSSAGTSGNAGSTAAGGSSPAGGASNAGNAGTSASAGTASGGAPALGCGDVSEPTEAHPELTPGVWKNITPAGLDLTGTYGTTGVTVDPTDPSVLYLDTDQRGIWKSTDGGSNWNRLGTPPDGPNYGQTADYIDSPVEVRVDPSDGEHLFAVQGVRGYTQGVWESTDGGQTWAQPPGFVAAAAEIGTADMTTLTVDPSDFKHMLVGSHSWWKGLENAGILETTDGGQTFIIHQPVASWAGGSIGIQFMYEPCQGIGDSSTWLVTTDGEAAFWRTTDSGENWTHLDSSLGGLHGQASLYYAKNGVAYSGAWGQPVRSTDNGVTWTSLSTLPYATYMSVLGDGNYLYTLKSCACGGGALPSPGDGDQPYSTSPEDDGMAWTDYQGGSQKFGNGPLVMDFDRANRILYSANWQWGLWALRVVDP